MLISLCNATRVQTLSVLDIQSMKKHKDEIIFFYMNGFLKQSHSGYRNPTMVVTKYTDI